MMGTARHIPNLITLARIPLTLLLLYFILRGEYVSAIPAFAAICLTDLLDGAAARALGACTRLGAYMDVAADLFYVMASLAVLNMKGLAPIWFTIVTAAKFIEFFITSNTLKKGNSPQIAWIFDGLGRCFSALAFLSPGVLCLTNLLPGGAVHFRYCFLFAACVFAAASSFARVVRCIMSMKPSHGPCLCNDAPAVHPTKPRNECPFRHQEGHQSL